MHHTVAVEHLVEDVHDVLAVADADDGVRLGELGGGLLAVALGETSRQDELLDASLLLELADLEDGLDGLLLRGLDEAAGVDDGNVRITELRHQLIAVAAQLLEHTLGIHQVLLASKGHDAYFDRHGADLLVIDAPARRQRRSLL